MSAEKASFNIPLDINEYRRDKKSQAISVVETLIDYKCDPHLVDEWIVPFKDEKDINEVIRNFFIWRSLELGTSIREQSQPLQLSGGTHGVPVLELKFDAPDVAATKKYKPFRYYTIRVYMGELSEMQKVKVNSKFFDLKLQ